MKSHGAGLRWCLLCACLALGGSEGCDNADVTKVDDGPRTCPDDGHPCTVDICESGKDVQHVQTPWAGCEAAVSDDFCHKSLDESAIPFVEQCTKHLSDRLGALRDTDEVDGIWHGFSQCMDEAAGCITPTAIAASSFATTVFTDDACKQTQMKACNADVVDDFERDMVVCFTGIPLSGGNPEVFRVCVILAISKEIFGKLQCFNKALCDDGQLCCAEVCVENDDANCGACGAACETALCQECALATSGVYQCAPACDISHGEQCDGQGQCICAPGLTNCNGTCVDTGTDAANCGRCGNACETCVGGACACTGAVSCGDGCCPPGRACGAFGQTCSPESGCQGGQHYCCDGLDCSCPSGYDPVIPSDGVCRKQCPTGEFGPMRVCPGPDSGGPFGGG